MKMRMDVAILQAFCGTVRKRKFVICEVIEIRGVNEISHPIHVSHKSIARKLENFFFEALKACLITWKNKKWVNQLCFKRNFVLGNDIYFIAN